MRVISKVKVITMAEEMAPSNKTRIAVPVDVIESLAVVFDGCRMSRARGFHRRDLSVFPLVGAGFKLESM